VKPGRLGELYALMGVVSKANFAESTVLVKVQLSMIESIVSKPVTSGTVFVARMPTSVGRKLVNIVPQEIRPACTRST